MIADKRQKERETAEFVEAYRSRGLRAFAAFECDDDPERRTAVSHGRYIGASASSMASKRVRQAAAPGSRPGFLEVLFADYGVDSWADHAAKTPSTVSQARRCASEQDAYTMRRTGPAQATRGDATALLIAWKWACAPEERTFTGRESLDEAIYTPLSQGT